MTFQNIGYFQTLARYNRWANARLYAACLTLSLDDYARDRAAYFRSIGDTLNHILVADRLWLARMAGDSPAHIDLAAIPFPDRDALWAARQETDAAIIAHFAGLPDSVLGDMLPYRDTRGMMMAVPCPVVFGHFFNHQTHHRGQVHNMLSQSGMDEPPPLDFTYYYHETKEAA